MVKAIVDISNTTNRILNIVKAKYDLKNKSEAINVVVMEFGQELLEPELRPEFIQKMLSVQKEKPIPVPDFRKRYGLD